MAYVVTDACTLDFVCVAECATAAIAPTAGDPAAGTVSQVFINPDECIDCGNCADLCAQKRDLPRRRSTRGEGALRREEPGLFQLEHFLLLL